MRIIPVVGLIFALVFGLIAFVPLIDLQGDIASLTTGGLQSVANLLPTFWFLLLAGVLVALVTAAYKLLG